MAGAVTESEVLKALVSVRGRAIARRLGGPGETELPEGIAVEQSRHRGVAVVAIEGELDVNSAPCVRAILADSVDDGPVVVDLRNVEFIDSMGLGALIAARRRGPGQLAVVISPQQDIVRKVFSTTRLDQAFPVLADVDSAVTALTAEA